VLFFLAAAFGGAVARGFFGAIVFFTSFAMSESPCRYWGANEKAILYRVQNCQRWIKLKADWGIFVVNSRH
jgi:hypothetical protein